MGNNKIDESLFLAVQDRVGYTDEQLALFKKHAFPHKILQTKVVENLLLTTVVLRS